MEAWHTSRKGYMEIYEIMLNFRKKRHNGVTSNYNCVQMHVGLWLKHRRECDVWFKVFWNVTEVHVKVSLASGLSIFFLGLTVMTNAFLQIFPFHIASEVYLQGRQTNWDKQSSMLLLRSIAEIRAQYAGLHVLISISTTKTHTQRWLPSWVSALGDSQGASYYETQHTLFPLGQLRAGRK